MTIQELLNNFSDYMRFERGFSLATVRAYLSDLRELALSLPNEVMTITIQELRAYQRELARKSLSPLTIERKFAAFTTFWGWLRIEGLVKELITEGIVLPKKPHKIKRWLSDSELNTLLTTPSPTYRGCPNWVIHRNETAWKTMVLLGLRRSELVGMKVNDLMLDQRLVIVHGIKNRRDRIMPIPDQLIADLTILIADQKAENYVFRSTKGLRWQTQSLARTFHRHLEKCGLGDKGISPHSLRHTFATSLIEQGVSLVDLKELLGHVDIKSTMVYVHSGSSRFRDAIERFANSTQGLCPYTKGGNDDNVK